MRRTGDCEDFDGVGDAAGCPACEMWDFKTFGFATSALMKQTRFVVDTLSRGATRFFCEIVTRFSRNVS